MSDLSGLTLVLTRPTTDRPALIAWSAKRDAERRAAEEKRAERARYFRELERAAIQSQTRPVKPVPRVKAERAPKPAREPGAPKPRGHRQDIKITPCVTCGRMTRGAQVAIDRAPGTIRRRAHGICVECPKPNSGKRRREPGQPLRVCAGTCGRMTRPAKMTKDEAPGTVPRKVHGKCSTCLVGKGGQLGPDPKVDPALLVEAYASGLSLRQVAVKFGIAQSTVKRHVGKVMPLRAKHQPAAPKVERAPAPPPIRLCAGSCGRLTKPKNNRYTHSDAIARVRDGKCSTCLTGGAPAPKVPTTVLVAEYTAGQSLQKLADRYGIQKSTVVWHLNRAGVQRRAATMHNGGAL